MEKLINYTFVGASIKTAPFSVTGGAKVRMLMRTKAGSYHVLLVTVDVSTAQHLRGVFGGVCAQFKTLAHRLWKAL